MLKSTITVAGVTLLMTFQSTGLLDALWKHLPQRRLTINLDSKASADDFQGYIPPVGRNRIQRTEGAGSRGCPNASFKSVSLLTPSNHVGLTLLARPTFSWYVSAIPSTAMQFALVEPGVPKPVFVEELPVQKSGIVLLTLPQNTPKLAVGKAYRWTVSLVCNSKHPSENIYVRSWIARVSNKVDQIQPLATATSTGNSPAKILRERTAVYAQAGIWYDAVASISKAYLDYPEERLNAEYLRLLLDQVGLSQVVIPELQPKLGAVRQ